jgi:endonuclease/exonuclease/phosphatase family metal-dependent hydrolase
MFRAFVTSLGALVLCVGCSNDKSHSGGAGGVGGAGGGGGEPAIGAGGALGGSGGSGGIVEAGEGGEGGRVDPASEGGEGGRVDPTSEGGAAPFAFRALTFNTALAPDFEPFAAQRAPKVIAALASAAADLDVMCVQEFWREEDFAALVAATNDSLPHTLHPAKKPGSGTCTADTLTPLGACLQAACPDAAGLGRVGCAEQACGDQVAALSGGCLGCIVNNPDDFGQCVGAGTEANDPAIFGGDNDVGLLSRYPLDEAESLPLDAYFVRTDVLHARVDIPSLGRVHVFCTHLGSSLGPIPYAGPYGSWDGEHTHQVKQLLDIVAQKASDSEPVILLGDLNTGPALPNIYGAAPDDYVLLAAQLENPYVLGGNAKCTECNDDSFRDADSHDDLIDHFLVRNFPSSKQSVERVFTDKVALDDTTTVNLSDHYGLRLVVTPN